MARFSSSAAIQTSYRWRSCMSAETASIGLLPGLDIHSPPNLGHGTTWIRTLDSGALPGFGERPDFVARQRVDATEEACREKDSCRLLDTLHSLMRDRERGAHRRRAMVRHQVGVVRRQERLE